MASTGHTKVVIPAAIEVNSASSWPSLLRPDGTHYAGEYRILDPIGHGNCTVVHIASHDLTRNLFAAKLIERRMIDCNRVLRDTLVSEIDALNCVRQLPHPQLTQLVDVIHTREKIVVVQRLGSGGDLFDYVARYGALPRNKMLRYLCQITYALLHLHQRCHMVHRDVKPENIVFIDDQQQDVMLVDLGFATFFNANSLEFRHSVCGTPSYMSPEAHDGPLTNQLMASDVWSLGVTLYVMATGVSLFVTGNALEIRRGISKIPEEVDEDIAELIRAMLCVDWRKRISLASVLSHRSMFPQPRSANNESPLSCSEVGNIIDDAKVLHSPISSASTTSCTSPSSTSDCFTGAD